MLEEKTFKAVSYFESNWVFFLQPKNSLTSKKGYSQEK
jgi:hypothetical protein